MKFIDVYFDYKKKYSNYIIICKIGNFYNIFGDDSKIIYLLTNYKVTYDNNIEKVGFPNVSLDRVIKKIMEEKINYIILEKCDGIISIKSKKRYIDNMYNNFSLKCQKYYEYKKRIENITIKLNSNIYNDNIDEILKQVENVI